ncbi:MAG TPA: TonB-dependent receptor, partial [Arachidicoccus sp.]
SYREGIEMQGAYIFAKWLNATANLSLSRNKIKSFTGYYSAYDADWNELPQQVSQLYHNTDIALSPSIVGASTINILPVKNLELSLMSKYVGREYMDNTQTKGRSVSGYYNQDARIMYTIKNKFCKEITIIATAYNVFNKKYNTIGYTYPEYDNGEMNNNNYFFPMAGTNYMVGVNIKL